MNYCRRCESDYEKPGTCNCFAEGGDAKPAETAPTPPVFPALPYVPAVPQPYVYPWWWGSGWWGIYPPTVSVPFVQTYETTDPKWSNTTYTPATSWVGGSDNVLWTQQH